MRSSRQISWSGLWAFAATETRVQLHEYLSIASSILVQVIFVFFVWLLALPLLPFALVGSMIFSAFVVGERVLDEAAYVRIDHKLNELYHASPMSPESYFLGMGMGVLVAYIPPMVMMGLIAEGVHPFNALSAGVLLLCLLAVWTIASSMGYALSTLFKDMRAIWPYATLLFNIFGVLPPVFYPLHIFPQPLWDVALVMPPSAAAALVMDAAGLQALTTSQMLLAAGALSVEAVGLFTFTVFWSRNFSREG